MVVADLAVFLTGHHFASAGLGFPAQHEHLAAVVFAIFPLGLGTRGAFRLGQENPNLLMQNDAL
jgi:hypothetical protein